MKSDYGRCFEMLEVLEQYDRGDKTTLNDVLSAARYAEIHFSPDDAAVRGDQLDPPAKIVGRLGKMVANALASAGARPKDGEVDYFGGCPVCGEAAHMNYHKTNLACCLKHKVFWVVGGNLFSSWRNESEDDWHRNKARIAGCVQVSPFCEPEPNVDSESMVTASPNGKRSTQDSFAYLAEQLSLMDYAEDLGWDDVATFTEMVRDALASDTSYQAEVATGLATLLWGTLTKKSAEEALALRDDPVSQAEPA